jgi:hypothetical protein
MTAVPDIPPETTDYGFEAVRAQMAALRRP